MSCLFKTVWMNVVFMCGSEVYQMPSNISAGASYCWWVAAEGACNVICVVHAALGISQR